MWACKPVTCLFFSIEVKITNISNIVQARVDWSHHESMPIKVAQDAWTRKGNISGSVGEACNVPNPN
jgi:hypothetical protein